MGGVLLMMHFTTSPVLIALMQTATMLPVFLVGLLAGTLADIVNRRPLLLATEGLMNAPLLLGFTFVIGLGAVLGNPAWQAVNTELVPPDELPAAVTLSSVSYNLARAVGPALAGLLVAVAGPAAVLLLNALAYLYVVVVLLRRHPAPHRAVLPAERLVGALRVAKRAWVWRAITSARVVLPLPGGPQRIIDGIWSSSMLRRSMRPGPRM
ncbi:MAG: MFS transporter [Chloroflexi bacterium]|nr:MAG: MFS transporter [Chloroflexota bacterium]